MERPVKSFDGARIPMLDMARLLGIALVYYGHVVERIMYLENPVATAHYKFIYSFHMPFFFLLAGMTVAPEKVFPPLGRMLKKLAVSRLIPYFFFVLVLLVLSLLFTGHFVIIPLDSAAGYMKGLVATLMGFPVFNVPLWFMACLVAVELMHGLVGRFLTKPARLLGVATACYVGGYYLTSAVQFVPGPNFWFLHEAIVMYAFYLVGVFLRRDGALVREIPLPRLALAAAICLGCVIYTWDMNQGPFRFFDAVVIVLSGHGDVMLFPLTALAGSLFLVLMGKLMDSINGLRRPLLWMGENVLILFCLNGVFYHFSNGPFADWFHANMPGHWMSVTGACGVFATLSMLACVPIIWLLNKYLPQLVGKPAASGPLLPALIKR